MLTWFRRLDPQELCCDHGCSTEFYGRMPFLPPTHQMIAVVMGTRVFKVTPSQPHQIIAAVAWLPGEFNVDARTSIFRT